MTDEVQRFSHVSATPTTNLNISWDCNFSNTSNNKCDCFDAAPVADDIYKTISRARRDISFEDSNTSMSENQGLFSDDNMSTDSDNQNMPDIDYQTELQSRHYYYASFVREQPVLSREIDGCECLEETVRRIISFEDSDEIENSRDDVGYNCDKSHGYLQTPNYGCNRIKKTHTLAYPSMIGHMDTTFSADDTDFSNASPSVTTSDFIPHVSSFVMNHTLHNSSILSCNSRESSDIENLSTNNSLDRVHVLPSPSYIDRLMQEESTCKTQDTLHAGLSSTLCREEFSLDTLNQYSFSTDNNISLPLTNTTADSNARTCSGQQQNGRISDNPNDVKTLNKTFTIHRVLHAVEKATRNLTNKLKTRHKRQTKVQQAKPQLNIIEVKLQDKRTVARKLQRFREIFRRKDTSQIRTLATL